MDRPFSPKRTGKTWGEIREIALDVQGGKKDLVTNNVTSDNREAVHTGVEEKTLKEVKNCNSTLERRVFGIRGASS